MLLGVQDVVGNALAFEHAAEAFRFFNGNGSYQSRAALLMEFSDLFYHCVKFFRLCTVHNVRVLGPDEPAIGRNDHHFEVVDGVKFGCLGICSTRHARELTIHAKVILKGNRG